MRPVYQENHADANMCAAGAMQSGTDEVTLPAAEQGEHMLVQRNSTTAPSCGRRRRSLQGRLRTRCRRARGTRRRIRGAWRC